MGPILQNHISKAVYKYLTDNPKQKKYVMELLGIAKEDKLNQKIKKNKWTEKEYQKLQDYNIVTVYKKTRSPRPLLEDAEKISIVVREWLDDIGSVSKLTKTLGLSQPQTLKNRMIVHNWTENEKAILINKRILDDSFM